jgi:hypothetical protein
VSAKMKPWGELDEAARLAGAGIDCSKSGYVKGIKALEDLLQRNKIPYPPG